VLPDAPVVTAVQNGGSDGGFSWNEIQSLRVPPEFRGTFLLRTGTYARTIELTTADTTETIQAALETILGKGNVQVTAGLDFSATIEFIGDLAASDQPLLVVEVQQAPAGDMTFTLALDKAELFLLLQRNPTITLPLQVTITTRDANDVDTKQVALLQTVTLVAPADWPELELVPAVDYTQPVSPKNYNPFSRTTVITGQQFYPAEVGDGAATDFEITHGLDTEAVFVWVRQNVSNGLQLIDGIDYRVHITNANSVEVTALLITPATNAWMVTVVSAQTVAAFADGLTVTVAQVTGLEARLAALEGRVTTIESVVGITEGGAPASIDAKNALETLTIPDFALTVPRPTYIDNAGRANVAATIQTVAGTSDTAKTTTTYTGTAAVTTAGQLVRYAPLDVYLAAVVEGTAKSAVTLQPDEAENGKVYLVSGAAVFIAGVGKRLVDGSHVAFANHHWFPVVQGTLVSGSTYRWWPAATELVLFEVPLSSETFVVGTRWTFLWTNGVQLDSHDHLPARGDYVLEVAELPADFGPNSDLDTLTWTNLLTFTRLLGDAAASFKGSLTIDRTATSTFAFTATLSGKTATITTTDNEDLLSANLIVRKRFEHFDCAADSDPRGALTLNLTGAQAALTKI
jgi:hypothetical protein